MSIEDVIFEAIIYGSINRLNRTNPFSWIINRKILYSKLVIKQYGITKQELYKYNRKWFVKNYKSKIEKYNKIKNSNNIIKEEYVDEIITSEIYRKIMYSNTIIGEETKIGRLVYFPILPEKHYDYSLYYTNENNIVDTDIYKTLCDFLGYFIPDGINAMEFCYLLLGEENTEELLSIYLENKNDNKTSNYLYGKFRGQK